LGLVRSLLTARTPTLLLALLLTVCAAWAVVKSIPDLSGKWKLNSERSSGRSLRQAATSLEIIQRGDEVKFVYYTAGARTGWEAFLADDIERARYETRIERAYAKVHWRKDDLIIVTRHVMDLLGYQAYTETDSWLLSEDRQTLTAKLSDGSLLVYEKEAADSEPLVPVDPLEGITPFRAVGVITGTGPCHGMSFEGTLKGEIIGLGKITFCGPPAQNWGGKPGSCGTESGTLTFSKDAGGSSFRMNVIGQFCISESGGTFRGSYEVDRITVTGGFQGHIKGGSGTVEFSNTSNTVTLYGVLLHD
jgi:hypothetical protein